MLSLLISRKAKVPDDMELMVKMTGELAQIMCEINPEMKCDDQGVLYLQCVKAFYGRIELKQLNCSTIT